MTSGGSLDFLHLALIGAIALLGPLLAWRRAWRLPVVLGEIVAGVAVGATGLGWLDASDPAFAQLAEVGFALVMFVAGTHVPVRDRELWAGIGSAAGRVVAVAALATGLGYAVAALVDSDHALLYAVIMASSSAALVLPMLDSLGVGGPDVTRLLPQIALADAACIVAVPLVVDPARAGTAALGAAAVVAAAALVFLVLRYFDRSGLRRRVHHVSAKRGLALELRFNLVVLFALAALATATHVSVMLAGFAFGIVVAMIGEPRRLARQVFGVAEGFLGPVFFVWLGASLSLGELWDHPRMVLLGLALGLGAVACHVAMRVVGQPVAAGTLAAAQLGVPMAAVALAGPAGLLAPGEGPAMLFGALVTVVAAILAGRRLAARDRPDGSAVASPRPLSERA